jgi:hypothetical protein
MIILFCAAAVWYLYRGIRKTVKGNGSACGCGGCEGCSAGSRLDEKGSSCGNAIDGDLNLTEDCNRKTVS